MPLKKMVAISVLAIVALGTLVSSEVHQDDGNFVGHSDRRLVRSLKSTKRGKGKKRQSKAKSGKSKGAKSCKFTRDASAAILTRRMNVY